MVSPLDSPGCPTGVPLRVGSCWFPASSRSFENRRQRSFPAKPRIAKKDIDRRQVPFGELHVSHIGSFGFSRGLCFQVGVQGNQQETPPMCGYHILTNPTVPTSFPMLSPRSLGPGSHLDAEGNTIAVGLLSTAVVKSSLLREIHLLRSKARFGDPQLHGLGLHLPNLQASWNWGR